ncbi:MAG: response regulator [Polyangiaceae bacterium]
MRTILLVEKSEAERTKLQDALRLSGYRVIEASSSSEARTALGNTTPELAVLSNSFSESIDVDLLQWLRAQDFGMTLPILVLSQGTAVHDRLSALTSGANDYIAWPIDPDHLVARVRSLINHRDHLPSVAPQGFARRILVVDDSPTYGNALLDELQKDGHDVALAENGNDALLYLDRHRADLVVLDVFLPDINGVEVCRRIKTSARTSGLLVLVLTGREKSAVRAEAAAAHADDFAVKSRDLEAIRSKVRVLLVRSSGRTVSSGRLAAAHLEPSAPPASSQGTRSTPMEGRRTISGPLSAVNLPSAEGRAPASSGRMIAAAPAVVSRALQGMELFSFIVQGTGLSELLARSTVESVCRRLDLDPRALELKDVPRVVEGLERTLQLFLPPAEAKERLRALGNLGQ